MSLIYKLISCFLQLHGLSQFLAFMSAGAALSLMFEFMLGHSVL